MSITFFQCGGPKPPPCGVPGCSNASVQTCAMPLMGPKTGTFCSRPVCRDHATPVVKRGPHASGNTFTDDVVLCPAHQRLVSQQERAAKGTRE
jgi:hypothetical protein